MPARKTSAQAGHSGSPVIGEPVYLAVGLLRRPHGVRGDILLTVLTDFPERLRPGTVLFLDEERRPVKITRRRPHNDGLLIGLEGVITTEQTAKYTGKTVFVRADDRPPLLEGEYYHHQIIGLQVVEENGKPLGRVSEILETGANDVYVVIDPAGHEILIPALKEVLLEINLVQQLLKVHLLPGLLENEES